VVFGADWLCFDPDQKHARINLKAVATSVQTFSPPLTEASRRRFSTDLSADEIHSTDQGKHIDFGYQGIITLNESVMSIFNMEPTSVSVPFGFSSKSDYSEWANARFVLKLTPLRTAGAHTFHSGAEELRELEDTTFVGNGRMLVDEKTRLITVESRISTVVPATGFD
jgi:Protein of unknown function (DUF3237)